MDKFDIVIIGSGLGGLTCGSILSKEGYKVCILEQNPQFGGCLQNFRRNGFIFDTGFHYVGGFEENQPLNKIFKYLGFFHKLNLQPLSAEHFDVIHIAESNIRYSFGLGYENFVENLVKVFPNERQSLTNYCTQIQSVCKNFHLYQLYISNGSNYMIGDFSTTSVGEFIDSVTKDIKLRTILAGNNMLYGGEKYKTPLYVHALITNLFITGAKYFVDGSQQLANELLKVILENGGQIFTNSKVISMAVDEGRISSVKTSKGSIFYAENFISSVHPARTLEMIDEGKIQKSYRNRINEIKNTISSFTLFIGFKENTFKYLNYNYYYGLDYNSIWGMNDYDFEKEWPKGFMMLTPPHSDSPVYAKTAIVNSLMNFDDVKQWNNTTVGKRGEDYISFKKKCTERMLDLIGKTMPGFTEKIAFIEAASPLTIRDYTGSRDGSLYGTKKDINGLINSHIPVRTKIGNLLFTGQNLNMHGILGVPLTAILTCGELVGMNYLINKINNASLQ